MTDNQPIPVNVNDAPLEDLVAIRGIGESLAKKIIDKRPFTALSDLVKISGINESKLATLLPYLTLGKPKRRETPKAEFTSPAQSIKEKPVTKLGHTEAFVFLEGKNERQDALFIILGGFILGLIVLFLRPSRD